MTKKEWQSMNLFIGRAQQIQNKKDRPADSASRLLFGGTQTCQGHQHARGVVHGIAHHLGGSNPKCCHSWIDIPMPNMEI